MSSTKQTLHTTFDLPYDLRHMIYMHLLTGKPEPDRSKVLFYDERPYHRRLSLHPALLLVSRETYKDTVPILYGNNAFEIILRGATAPPDQRVPPLDHCLNPITFLRNYRLFTLSLPSKSLSGGLISPSALYALRHISLSFSYDSFWGSTRLPYLTTTGQLILNILDILGRDPNLNTCPVIFDHPQEKQRNLTLTIYSDAHGKWLNEVPQVGSSSPDVGKRSAPFAMHLRDLVFLVENLKSSTKVVVWRVLRKVAVRSAAPEQATLLFEQQGQEAEEDAEDEVGPGGAEEEEGEQGVEEDEAEDEQAEEIRDLVDIGEILVPPAPA